MLVTKSVQVEDKVEDLMEQVVAIVVALKAGTPVATIALNELLKLQSAVADIQALPADFQESFTGAVNAVVLNSVALAAAALGKN